MGNTVYTPEELRFRARQRTELSKVRPWKDVEYEPSIGDDELSQDDKEHIASYLLDKFGG